MMTPYFNCRHNNLRVCLCVFNVCLCVCKCMFVSVCLYACHKYEMNLLIVAKSIIKGVLIRKARQTEQILQKREIYCCLECWCQ